MDGMSARESAEIVAALATIALEPQTSLNEIASRFGLSRSTLTRAMRRRGIPPRPHPRGETQAAYLRRSQAAS